MSRLPVLLLVGACARPEAQALPPQPERARWALWDLNGSPWGEGLVVPSNLLSLASPYQLEVAYFGCDQLEIAGTPAGERGCRPTTQTGYRLSDADPEWSLIDPAEPVSNCECADLDPYVLRTVGPIIADRDRRLLGATILPTQGPLPDLLLAFSDRRTDWHYRVSGQGPEDEAVRQVATSTIAVRSSALWAEADGTVWSAGASGLYRGDSRSEELVLRRVPFAAARTRSMSFEDVRLEPISLDPLRLLMVDGGGLTLLWDRSGVTELQPGRGVDELSHIRGDRADVAPLYERGELRGWVLLGPPEPERPEEDDWQNSSYVVYRDGVLGRPLPLPRIQAVAGSKELGTFGVDSNGGLFSLTAAGATPIEFGVGLAAPKVLRIFDGHFVLSREESPVVHYRRLDLGCTGRGNELGEVLHIFSLGELLVEVGFSGQVRWSRARSVCNLSPP